MLQILRTSPPPPLQQARPTPILPPLATMRARNIVKGHRSVRQRAELAARWMLDRLIIEGRTTTMAALIFGVSYASVPRALARIGGSIADYDVTLNHYWRRASDYEREEFVRANLLSVWDAVESVTR
jgi:hypothetical protein